MGEPFNGVPHGWAFRVGVGAWRWSMGVVGYSRDDAIECGERYRCGPHEPLYVTRVWERCSVPNSPIDVDLILDRADEMLCDAELIVPDSGPIVQASTADMHALQSALDEVWLAWLAERSIDAAWVDEESAEEIVHRSPARP